MKSSKVFGLRLVALEIFERELVAVEAQINEVDVKTNYEADDGKI